jgi:hypothetical protein
MSGLGPSPTAKVRRTTTWRLRIGLNRTAVNISSRISYASFGRGEVMAPQLAPQALRQTRIRSGVRGSDLSRHVLHGQRALTAISPRLPISPPRANS